MRVTYTVCSGWCGGYTVIHSCCDLLSNKVTSTCQFPGKPESDLININEADDVAKSILCYNQHKGKIIIV